jgi:DNA-binding NarL/FixJ family response regulator
MLEARGFEVVGEANNSVEAVRQCAALRPHVVVLDTSMERSRNLNVMLSARLNSVEATRRIMELFPATRVIMTTLHPDLAYVAESVNAGVNGYILKTKVAESLADTIRAVTQGAIVLGAGISGAARAS